MDGETDKESENRKFACTSGWELAKQSSPRK